MQLRTFLVFTLIAMVSCSVAHPATNQEDLESVRLEKLNHLAMELRVAAAAYIEQNPEWFEYVAESQDGVEPQDYDHPLFQSTLKGLASEAERVLGDTVAATAESTIRYERVLLVAGAAHILDTGDHVAPEHLRWWVEPTSAVNEFDLVCPHGFIVDLFESPAFRMRFRASFNEADEIEAVHLLSVSDGSE